MTASGFQLRAGEFWLRPGGFLLAGKGNSVGGRRKRDARKQKSDSVRDHGDSGRALVLERGVGRYLSLPSSRLPMTGTSPVGAALAGRSVRATFTNCSWEKV
jgi:hypothetical protein